jgi:hypothetical protein
MKMKMKKYLITGALALVACATLTSCHSDDELSGSLVQQKIKAYEQVFEEEFGKVDPNQDWGFGTAELLARTRTAMARTRADGETEEVIDPATYVGAYPNAHLWTSEGFKAPDALTEGQKLRVQYYFQMNKITNPNQPDNGPMNFFMQQVYDGATDPITNYKEGNYSSEMYVDGDGNSFDSGDIMNYLKAGSDHQHVNNFNNANYPDPIPNVANWNQTVMDDPSQEHPDQIMLMLHTKTDCFGYLDSNNNVFYDDQWTLVSCQVIDNYCDVIDPDGYQAFLRAHTGVEDKVVTDRWERGFIGFDFKLMPDPDPIIEGEYALYSDARDQSQGSYVYNGTNITTIADKNTRILINNSPIPVLSDNLNFYGGNVLGCGGERGHSDFEKFKAYDPEGENDDCLYLTNHTAGVQSDYYALNLKFIVKMVGNGYLPVHGTSLRLWAKPNDMTDGFYSDWIVSFMPAEYSIVSKTDKIDIEQGSQTSDYTQDWYYKYTTLDEEASRRIFCEDLGVVRASDIDFNDIVFDVLIYKTQYITYHMISSDGVHWDYDTTHYPNGTHRVTNEADNTYNGDIWLLAGGGTIQAVISVPNEDPNKRGNWNIKNAFSVGLPSDEVLSDNVIVNTIMDDTGRYGNQYRNDITPKKLNDKPLAITSASQVDISVKYGSQFHTLTAYKGAAPHKLCVPRTNKWLKEREEIKNGYPHFVEYVKYQDKDGNKLTEYANNPGVTLNDDENDPGYVGNGKERYKYADSVWDDPNEGALYTIETSYNYTSRQLSGVEEENGKSQIYGGGGTNSGYRQVDDVLVRRRH